VLKLRSSEVKSLRLAGKRSRCGLLAASFCFRPSFTGVRLQQVLSAVSEVYIKVDASLIGVKCLSGTRVSVLLPPSFPRRRESRIYFLERGVCLQQVLSAVSEVYIKVDASSSDIRCFGEGVRRSAFSAVIPACPPKPREGGRRPESRIAFCRMTSTTL